VESDPHETKDLAASPEHGARIREMMTSLQQHQKELGDRLPLTSAQPRSPVFVPPANNAK